MNSQALSIRSLEALTPLLDVFYPQFLQLDLSKAVGEVTFAPLVCSAVMHVHRLLKTGESHVTRIIIVVFIAVLMFVLLLFLLLLLLLYCCCHSFCCCCHC